MKRPKLNPKPIDVPVDEEVQELFAQVAPMLMDTFHPRGIALFVFDPESTDCQLSILTNADETYVAKILKEWARIKDVTPTLEEYLETETTNETETETEH